MKNKILFLMAGVICTFLFGSCEEENNEENLNGFSTAQQVDMTVLVPIHPSSLEYFDYVIHYYDNRGVECRDTIQNPSGGIEVVDWIAANGISNNCYVRTFSYDDLFVTCSVNVEMIPKKGLTTMDPFYFYIPKPYITPSVHDTIRETTTILIQTNNDGDTMRLTTTTDREKITNTDRTATTHNHQTTQTETTSNTEETTTPISPIQPINPKSPIKPLLIPLIKLCRRLKK